MATLLHRTRRLKATPLLRRLPLRPFLRRIHSTQHQRSLLHDRHSPHLGEVKSKARWRRSVFSSPRKSWRSITLVDLTAEGAAINAAVKMVAEVMEEIGWERRLCDLTEPRC